MIDKILPVDEMVAYDEFTDRVELLRELDAWVKNIQRMASSSTAIISPRRMGKTVLLERLVNIVFFKPEYKVAPFYLRIKREETTLRDFLLEYATTFFRQYIAYCNQDPALYSSQKKLEDLLQAQSTHQAVDVAKEYIKSFIDHYYNEKYDDYRNQWDNFIKVPEQLGSLSGVRVAIIIDEFQDMKFYINDISNESLDRIIEMRRKNPDIQGTDLTATYDRMSQSRKAPMLVSGSDVTLIFRTVMGGPLGGRFDFIYLKPLSIPDGAVLLNALISYYLPGMTISTENAFYASSQVNGHPYYLYCLALSKFEKKSFKSKKSIDRLVQFEIEQGKIYGFWLTHFEDNRKYINADDDEEIGKKIIYYFTQYNDRPVNIKEIAETMQIPKIIVEKKIEKLYQADLVYRSAEKFYTFNDICLMRFIQFVYEQDLKEIKKVDLSQKKLFHSLKGKFLEMVVQGTMMKFNHEMIDGTFFGKPGKVEVPLFQVVDTKYVKGFRTPQYQIDLCGMERNGTGYWICECKYTKTKMGIQQVKKLENAVNAFQQEFRDAELDDHKVIIWLISTGGFTKEVIRYVNDRNDIYYSDYDGINNIFHLFGGNYTIPIFK